MNHKLILRSKNSPFVSPHSDINKGSVLSHADLDNNFINIKGNLIYTGDTSGTTLTLYKINGETIPVDLSGLINAGDTFVSGATIVTGLTVNTLVLSRTDGGTVSVPLLMNLSDMTYTNPNPTLVDVGGVKAGSTFNNVPLQDMWTDLLYPELPPSFKSFVLVGTPVVVEVGYTIPAGNATFTWTTENPTFIQPNSIRIRDIINNDTLVSGSANDGSEAVMLPISISKNINTTHTWTIDSSSLSNSSFSRNHVVSWRWRNYFGNNLNTLLTDVDVKALSNSGLATGSTGKYIFSGGGYKYLCFPDVFGNPISFKDESTNIDVAMADNSDGYLTLGGGNYYNTVTITNQYGASTLYRIYRSKNILGGAINIIVG